MIRRISQVIPKDSKKKTNLNNPSNILNAHVLSSDKTEDLKKEPLPANVKEYTTVSSDSETRIDLKPNQYSEQLSATSLPDSIKTEDVQSIVPSNTEPPLRVTDPEKILDRIQSLPVEVREVIDEKFRGEYFAIERIDRNILI